MSTSSANATPMPSRRNLITQAGMLASLGTVGATMALPVHAADTGPIERMYAEHVRLTDALYDATEARFEAERRYTEPPRPLWHPLRSAGSYRLEQIPGKQWHCCLDDRDENVAELRTRIATPYVVDPAIWITETMHQAGIDRAKDTLAQIEAWQAEAKRCADAAGLTQALEVEEQATAVAAQHGAAVLAIEPSTYREVAFQAAVLQLAGWDEDQVETLLMRLTDLAGINPYLDA